MIPTHHGSKPTAQPATHLQVAVVDAQHAPFQVVQQQHALQLGHGVHLQIRAHLDLGLWHGLVQGVLVQGVQEGVQMPQDKVQHDVALQNYLCMHACSTHLYQALQPHRPRRLNQIVHIAVGQHRGNQQNGISATGPRLEHLVGLRHDAGAAG